MRAMLADHRKDVAAFKKESTRGNDPDVKQFASQTLPTLEEHLKIARDLSGSSKGAGKASSKGAK
jgi:putative membrane protein